VFQGLDFVIAESKKRGLKLILPLVNYWHEYGGYVYLSLQTLERLFRPKQYSRLAATPPTCPPTQLFMCVYPQDVV
jgi:hypothetical protein